MIIVNAILLALGAAAGIFDYRCSMRNWHRYMDRRPRCSTANNRKVCDCEDFYVWPVGTFGRSVKVAFPSHFDKFTDAGFPVVIQFHGTNMDPITTFSEALSDEIEFDYVGDTKVDITTELLRAGYAVVAPAANEALNYWQTNIWERGRLLIHLLINLNKDKNTGQNCNKVK